MRKSQMTSDYIFNIIENSENVPIILKKQLKKAV